MFKAEPQDAVIRHLSSPAAYPGHVGSVETITTHASVIFLAGDRAYKLKRALRYSYLDYSSAELRRSSCESELALNRRTAPNLYLSVLPICKTDAGDLRLGGSGQPVDWLVEMRRFPQESLFSALADRHELTASHIFTLAGRIAAFHDAAPTMPDHGGVAGIKTVIAINDENLRHHASPAIPASEIAALTRVTEANLVAQDALLESRRIRGMVRRCHGDLHLANICLFEGQPTLFDCIEFNDWISCIDVFYDLAFALMDLRHRGLTNLCASLFNRYVDLTGDEDGVATLPLFMSLRAAVRAHVNAASYQADEPAFRSQRTDEVRSYFRQARDILQPRPPRLIAIGGLSGTGKSTIAAAIAGDFGIAAGARVLRSDVLRKRLFGKHPEDQLPNSAYRPTVNEHVYADIATNARRLLRAGHTVIVDAVSAQPAERAALQALAQEATAQFTGVWLHAAEGTLAHRLECRRDDASDATIAVLKQQLAYDLGRIDWIQLDAGRPVAVVAQDIRDLAGD